MIEPLIRDAVTPTSGAIKGEQASAPRLHYARLVGSYHAYKGAGDPAMFAAWLGGLGFDDLHFIQLYRAYGQAGPVDLDPPAFERVALSVAVGLALGNFPAAAAQLEAAEAAARAQAQVEAMGQTFAGAAQQLSEAFGALGRELAQALGPAFVEDGAGAIKRALELYETIERVALADQLRAAYVPGSMADWLAQHWPAWAIPRRMRARVLDAWDWIKDRVWPTY